MFPFQICDNFYQVECAIIVQFIILCLQQLPLDEETGVTLAKQQATEKDSDDDDGKMLSSIINADLDVLCILYFIL